MRLVLLTGLVFVCGCGEGAATDAGLLDSSALDAARDDAGLDANVVDDAGRSDASEPDSGLPDAAMSDSGVDAAMVDAGVDGGPADACVAIVEDCFDGIDTDCDGAVDCADPDCAPTAECVPAADGYSFGTLVDVGVACTSDFAAGSTELMRQINAGTTCLGCSCQPAVICSATLTSHTSCGGIASSSLVVSSAGCVGASGATTNLSVGSFTALGACAPRGTPSVSPATFDETATFCATERRGGGCGASEVCVPRSTTPHCVLAAGTLGCPTGYAGVGGDAEWYTGADDTRTCGTMCRCDAGSGANCGTSRVQLYFGEPGVCGGTTSSVAAMSSTCFLPSPPTAVTVTLQGETNPTCNPTNTVTGAATPTGAHSVCCLP